MNIRLKIYIDHNFLASGKLYTTMERLSKDSNVETKHTQNYRKMYLYMNVKDFIASPTSVLPPVLLLEFPNVLKQQIKYITKLNNRKTFQTAQSSQKSNWKPDKSSTPVITYLQPYPPPTVGPNEQGTLTLSFLYVIILRECLFQQPYIYIYIYI